jgi:transposase InsO family protein
MVTATGGLPAVLRMNNPPELISQALQRFCDSKVGLYYIPSRCPWDNGYIESFNNRIWKECLSARPPVAAESHGVSTVRRKARIAAASSRGASIAA